MNDGEVVLQTVKLAKSMKCAILVSSRTESCIQRGLSLQLSCPAHGHHCNERLEKPKENGDNKDQICS